MSGTSNTKASALTDSDNEGNDAQTELTAVVDDLLDQLSTKFTSVSRELTAKMDDMSRRLDNLEAIIQSRQGDGDQGK